MSQEVLMNNIRFMCFIFLCMCMAYLFFWMLTALIYGIKESRDAIHLGKEIVQSKAIDPDDMDAFMKDIEEVINKHDKSNTDSK